MRSRLGRFFGWALAALALASCSADSEPLPPSGAAIVLFKVTPQSAEMGETVEVSWVTLNASQFSLTANGQAIAVEPASWSQGSADAVIEGETTFRLEVRGKDGETYAEERTVQVIVPPAAVIEEFRADPPAIPVNGVSTLVWRTSNATKIQISDNGGRILDLKGASPEAGQLSVTTLTSRTYTLLAEARGGNSEATVTVAVVPAPTITISASPPVINAGSSSTLSWTATDTNRIVVRAGVETLLDTTDPEVSSLDVSPTLTTLYTVEAHGYGGIDAAEVEVGVDPGVLSFEVDAPAALRPGMMVELSWITAGASALTLTNDDGYVEEITGEEVAAGSRLAPVGHGGVFRLLARHGARMTEASLSVDLVDEPVIVDLHLFPDLVTAGPGHPAEVRIAWSISGARSLTLSASPGGAIPMEGVDVAEDELTVAIQGPTRFTLTAENAAGFVSRELFVDAVPPPQIQRFDARPVRVAVGETTTITWEVEDAVSIELLRDGAPVAEVGPTDFSGTYETQLSAETTFVLRATNSLDFVRAAELTVEIGAPELLSFDADRRWYPVRGTVTLSWESSGGDALVITTEEGSVFSTRDPERIHQGEVSLEAPEAEGPITYTLSISNGAGEDSESVRVDITEAPVIERFSVSAERISDLDSLILSWEVTTDAFGAIPSLSLRDDRERVYDISEADALQGSAAFRIEGPGRLQFTLEATTGAGRTTESTVDVEVIPLPSLIAWSVSPTFVSSEQEPAILEWETMDAVRLDLFPLGDDGSVTGGAIYTTTTQVDEGTTTIQPTFLEPHVRLVLQNELGGTFEEDLRIGVLPATITRFEADPPVGGRGERTTLSWTTERSARVELVAVPFVETEEAFIDLSTSPTATRLGFSTGWSATEEIEFPGGFVFPFDQAPRTSVVVTNNGYLSFNPTLTTAPRIMPALPSLGAVGADDVHLAPFASARLDRAGASGEIFYELRGEGAGRHLVIQWHRMTIAGSAGSLLSFEVVLWSDGSFDFRYGPMSSPDDPDLAAGSVATIGYQNARTTRGVQLSRGEAWDGGLSNRAFHFPIVARTMRVERTEEPFLDIVGAPDAVEQIQRSPFPDSFGVLLVDPFPEGFVFPFDGQDRTGVRIAEDGYLSFALRHGSAGTTIPHNEPLAQGSVVFGSSERVHIAPYWTNLVYRGYLPARGEIWTALRNDERGRFFVIQWKGFSRSADDGGERDSDLNFQVLLWEDGSFEFRYGTMHGGTNPAHADGSLATIGFQEVNGIRGLNHSHQAAIPGGLSGVSWTFLPNPPLPLSGELEIWPRGSIEYTLVAKNGHSSHRASVQVEREEGGSP